MQEQGETTVSIRALPSNEAVQVTVDRSSPLGDIKKVLADMFDRPEIATDGQFLKQMPNGATVKMHDAQKIGTRRELLYEGPPLSAPSEGVPLTNLEEFDGYDENVEVLSPRSLRALELQGVSADELYYAPAECFWEPDLDRRIMQLHHDFFEAWRQDTLSMCRAQRLRIVKQDVGADTELDKSTRDWMKSINCSKQDDGVDQLSVSPTSMPRFLNTAGSPEEQIAGTGGNWAGILEPHVYPLTNQFFEDLQYWMQMEKVLERAHPGDYPAHVKADNKPAKGRPVHGSMVLDASGRTAKEALEEVERQRRRSSRERHQILECVVADAESLVAVADAQKKRVHHHIQEVNSWRGHREACSQESRGPWQNHAQETNFANAYRRCDSWHHRREDVHKGQIRAEDARYEATVKLAERDVEVKLRVGRMRDMAKVKFSRQWIERRTRWLRGHAMASKASDASKIAIINKQKNAQARIHDRNVRVAKLIEVKKEFKALRRMMNRLTSLAGRREARRREQRRQDVVKRLTSFADEAEAHSRSREVTGTPKGWRAKRPQHLSFMSTASPESTATLFSPASTSLVSASTLSGGERRHVKRFPRFDFGRFGAESLAVSGASGPGMQKSASLPA
ncbi:gpt [Symbiodinium pilosum]|uniref:Gpt protein n=1 Tax=Symbiodinium pilosum TaxID=2952 RepID=A0A812N5D9_SYMPI|nr:gpt [Symbiodinium pilosum]